MRCRCRRVPCTGHGEWRSGSAPALGAGGRGFKSPLPDHLRYRRRRTCGCSSTARAPAFQAGGAGSIPVTRSTSVHRRPQAPHLVFPHQPAARHPDHRRRHRGHGHGDAPRPSPRAGGLLLRGRRPRVGRVRRAGHRVRDPPRPGGRPRLHQLRRVPRRRRGGGAGRGPAARDGPAPARPRGSRAVGPARLLRPSRRPPGVAADGGGRAGRVGEPVGSGALQHPPHRRPPDPCLPSGLRQVARPDLRPRAGPQRPRARRGGGDPRDAVARAVHHGGGDLLVHAVLRRQRRGRPSCRPPSSAASPSSSRPPCC